MESYISPEYLAVADPKQQQHLQQQQLLQATANFDFLSFTSPSDVLAPHPDLFESELDSSLAGFDPLQLQSILLDQNFDFLQTEITSCGPPSTITVSTESVSAYDSLSGQSESLYNYTPSNCSFPLDLEIGFSRATLGAQQDFSTMTHMQSQVTSDNRSDYMYSGGSIYSSSSGNSPNEFSEESDVYPSSYNMVSTGRSGSVYSDFGSSPYNPVGSNHPSLRSPNTLSPGIINSQRAQMSSAQLQMSGPIARAPSPIGTGLNMSLIPNISRSEPYRRSPESQDVHPIMDRARSHFHDDEKKHTCPTCGKQFSRKYNMKSHLETHDTSRNKKFKCECCMRSFSRKHDLRRHYLSIHNQTNPPLDGSNNEDSSIGLASLVKNERCSSCGASERQCSCGEEED